MASPCCIIQRTMKCILPNYHCGQMIKQFVETLFYLLYNYGTLWMSGLNALQYTHACEYYIYSKWFQNKLVALLLCGSHQHLADQRAHRNNGIRNEKRPAAGGETNSAKVNWSVRLSAMRETPGSRSIPMRLVRKLAEIRLRLTKRRLRIYLHAALNPIHASLCLFVCASGEFIQPPHSFINKLLAACTIVAAAA